jgi:hypothetical protein
MDKLAKLGELVTGTLQYLSHIIGQNEIAGASGTCALVTCPVSRDMMEDSGVRGAVLQGMQAAFA